MNPDNNILSPYNNLAQVQDSYITAKLCIPNAISDINLALATNNIIALNGNMHNYATQFDIYGLQHVKTAMKNVERMCLEANNLFEIEPAIESVKTLLQESKQTINVILHQLKATEV